MDKETIESVSTLNSIMLGFPLFVNVEEVKRRRKLEKYLHDYDVTLDEDEMNLLIEWIAERYLVVKNNPKNKHYLTISSLLTKGIDVTFSMNYLISVVSELMHLTFTRGEQVTSTSERVKMIQKLQATIT